jgi:hypothetical protein
MGKGKKFENMIEEKENSDGLNYKISNKGACSIFLCRKISE